jgi:hypothetical protein
VHSRPYRGETGDVDEAGNIRRIARLGDDHPTIAVADQEGRALLQIQHAFGRRDAVTSTRRITFEVEAAAMHGIWRRYFWHFVCVSAQARARGAL